MFRFIHTADIHLDSPLKSLARRDPEASALVANATRQSFVNIIDLCIEEQVDALIIAGDLYDGEWRSMKTAEFFSAEMRRLVAEGIKAYIVRGNHDAESRITKQLRLPDGVHVFTGRGESFYLDDKEVAIHGVSFAKPKAPESLLHAYPAKKPGYRNIGVLHTSLAGSPNHDTYAPCSVEDLMGMNYDYWALGHIHKRGVYSKSPGIVMPGIPQGRHINEAGLKTVTLVTLGESGEISLEERITSVVQFELIPLDVTGLCDWDDFLEKIETTFNEYEVNIQTPYAVVRIAVKGSTVLAARLRRDADLVLSEIKEAGRRTGKIFVEKCDIECVSLSATSVVGVADPVSELRELMANTIQQDESLQEDVLKLLNELQKKLPPEIRDSFNGDGGLLKDYFEQGVEEILAHLEHASGESNAL